MEFEIAKQVNTLMLELSARLDASVKLVMETSDSEEFHRYRQAIGKIMGAVYLDVLSPLYAEHPSLTPEGLIQGKDDSEPEKSAPGGSIVD